MTGGESTRQFRAGPSCSISSANGDSEVVGHFGHDRLPGARRRRAALSKLGGRAVQPSPATVVTIARRLMITSHAQVERAVRRVCEEAQSWEMIAPPTRPSWPSTTARAWPLCRRLSGPGFVGLPGLRAHHR